MQSPELERSARSRKLEDFRNLLIILVIVSFTFRILGNIGLGHTSLIFIGLPALLAWLVAASAPPRTAMGSVMRTTTLALLVSWIFLGEAGICVLMAAPVFYLLAFVVGCIKTKLNGPASRGLTALVVLPLALEGTHPALSVARERVVVVEDTVHASVEAVRRTLADVPQFDRPLPLFFRLGFPTPTRAGGTGLAVRDRRNISFAHGGHHPGQLILEIVAATPSRIEFATVLDDSYIVHWLYWRGAVVEFRPVDTGRTHVRWTLRYSRRLDPSWYFDPLEKYGVTLAAKYLLATLTTPPAADTR